MGAWGTKLFDNDYTSDVRGDYKDLLRRCKDAESALQELLSKYQADLNDPEDGPLFWLALADTQWEYGRLTPEVQEKALALLEKGVDQERWREAGEEQLQAWNETCKKLEEKLCSPQPRAKRIVPYRFYRCPWSIGDVFAYRFTSEYSKEKGFYGQYVAFVKVGEDTWWPGHTIPTVALFKRIEKDLPQLEELPSFGLMEVGFFPSVFQKRPDTKREYLMELIIESAKQIPHDNLTYLGRINREDIPQVAFSNRRYPGGDSIGWEGSKYYPQFEHEIINMYTAWRTYEK